MTCLLRRTPIRLPDRPIRALLAALGLVLTLTLVAATPVAGAPANAPESDALERLREGDREGAARVLEAAMAEDGATAETRSLLGAVYLDLGRPAEAVELLQAAAEADEADAVTLFNLGRALLALERADEAEDALRRASARAPLSRASLLLASLYAERGAHAEAGVVLGPLAVGDDAAAVAAEDPELAGDVALLYGRSLAAAGDHATAVIHLRRATRLLEDRPGTWQALGDALTELERLDEAYAALARARELEEDRRRTEVEDAERARSFVQRATELREEGRLEEALAALRESIRLAPAEPMPRTLEVRLLLDMGRAREALEVAEGLVDLTRGDAEALHLRGMSHLFLEDLPAAEEDFRAVLDETPRHRAAMNALALVLARRGAREEAEQLLERVLDLWPDDSVARRTLRALRAGG